MEKVIVIGAKGTALCIGEQIVEAHEKYGAPVEFLGWALDSLPVGSLINGYPVLCRPIELMSAQPRDVKLIYSLYKPEKMIERVALLQSYNLPAEKFFVFVHPTASVMKSVTLGYGSVILSHSVVHSNSIIGNCTIINPNVVIEHDTHVGNNCFLASSACVGSGVQIGQGAFVGLNSTIRENLEIGEYAFIGMGSNVVKKVYPNQIVYGNPARSAHVIQT